MPIQAHFTNIKNEILCCIENANDTIYAAIAWLTDYEIMNALLQKANKNVRVELIISDDLENKKHQLIQDKLTNAGVQLYVFNKTFGIMHHKFCIIDNKQVIMGSYNWTISASKYNNESIIIIHDEPAQINHFINEFKSLKNKLGVVDEKGIAIDYSSINLKTEIIFLENEIAILEESKALKNQQIFDFEIKVKQALGHLILLKLNLETTLKELHAKLTEKAEDILQATESKNQTKYYEQQITEAKETNIIELDENEKTDLRKIYLEAFKLVHPDLYVDNEEKFNEANHIAAILNDAYKNKDIKKVSEILESLKNGTAFKTDWMQETNAEKLRNIITSLKQKIKTLKQEIEILHAHIFFSLPNENDALSNYLTQVETEIKHNIETLQQQIKQYQ